jgi:hypothetical protein
VVKYVVDERDGCILVTGAMPPEALLGFSKRLGRRAVMCPDTARMAGATFAMGRPEALDALRAELADGCRERIGRMFPSLPAHAREWLATGRQGLSSAALFAKAMEVRPPDMRSGEETAFPHDPGDLLRCLRLIEAVPEVGARLGEMSAVSPAWAALVGAWPQLVESLDREIPDWRSGGGGSAPVTRELMRACIAKADAPPCLMPASRSSRSAGDPR